MKENKDVYKLLGFAVLAEIVILSDLFVSKILSAVTDNMIVQYASAWILAYIIWGTGFFIISKKSRPLRIIEQAKPNWAVYIIALVIVVILSAISWGGFKPYIELTGAVSGLGAGFGLAAFALQYLYYALEAALMLVILSCGQLAGEKLFGKNILPYGGIVLALLWGLPHAFTQGITGGLWAMLFAFIYGIAYNAVKGQKKIAYPLILLLFVI